MEFGRIADRLKGKLFLSSMLGTCDGAWCASRAKGCAMVQLGAFVLLKERDHGDMFWPDPARTALTAVMRREFDTCRAESARLVGESKVPVISANVFPCSDEDCETSARAFVDAGGELYELNAHGGIGGDRERGSGCMLLLPEHTPKLIRWAKMIVAAGGPVAIKSVRGATADFTDHLKQFEDIGVHAFHINVRGEKDGEQDLELLESIRRATGMFLLASGHVGDARSAKALFDAGADCVGIAQAAMNEPDIFLKCCAES